MAGTPQAFQSDAFQNDAFQTGLAPTDPNAFQCSAFQNNAFQNPSCSVVPPTPDIISGGDEGLEVPSQRHWIDFGYYLASGGKVRSARPTIKRGR